MWRRGGKRGGKQGHLRSFCVSVDAPSTTSWRGRVQHRSCLGALALARIVDTNESLAQRVFPLLLKRAIPEKIAKFCFGLLFEIYNPEYHDITDWLILHHLTYFASFDLSLAYDQVHLFQAFFPFVRKSKEQGPISCANNSRKSCLPTTSQTDLGPSRKTS